MKILLLGKEILLCVSVTEQKSIFQHDGLILRSQKCPTKFHLFF